MPIAIKMAGKEIASYDTTTDKVAIKLGDDVSINDSAGNVVLGNSGLTSNVVFPAGHVIQVESVIKTSVFETQSTSFTDVPGLSVGITPSSASNKILVMCSFLISTNSGSGYPQAKMLRNGSDIYVGDPSSQRRLALLNATGYNADSNYSLPVSFQFLDSPASTSLQTYKIQCLQTAGNTTRINAVGGDPDSIYGVRSASSIVLLEIKE